MDKHKGNTPIAHKTTPCQLISFDILFNAKITILPPIVLLADQRLRSPNRLSLNIVVRSKFLITLLIMLTALDRDWETK